jgi:F-type H+-transporting ATPase subunit b
LEQLGINLGYLLVQLSNFFVLFIVLRAWVYKPIVGLLEKRRAAIAQGLEDARIAAEARANAEKEAQSVLAKAQQEANAVVRQASERAEQAAKEITAAAEKEATEIRENAVAEARQIKEQALADLRGQIAALAVAAAQKVLGEALDEKRQHALIDEFFSGVRGGKVVVLGSESLSGSSAEVVSALPLTPEEQEAIRKDVLGKLGSGAQVQFRVDPAILGGLVIRVGDRVIDGSVSGRLEGLRQSLR